MEPIKVADAMSPEWYAARKKAQATNTRKMPLFDRFNVWIHKTESCWNWTGTIHRHGYGMVCVGGRAKIASRVSYELFVSAIPDGMQVLHKCDNRMCVNPDNLFLGTNSDNVQDRVAKGRSAVSIGERNANAKLSEEQVREIRRLRTAGERPKDLGLKFGVAAAHITQIAKGRAWSHL